MVEDLLLYIYIFRRHEEKKKKKKNGTFTSLFAVFSSMYIPVIDRLSKGERYALKRDLCILIQHEKFIISNNQTYTRP